MKKTVFCAGTALLFALALLFPRASLLGARSGLLLWYNTLVPSLFPVMILSRLLLKTGMARRISGLISRPFTALLGISPCGVYALLTGFLCGCPMGAKVLADLRADGQISQPEAVYLAAFCNNLSPAFFVNYLVLQYLSADMLAPTLVILFGAPLLYGLFTNRRFRKTQLKNSISKEPPAAGPSKNKAPATAAAMVDACIMDSICGITKLGGYVILFSAVSAVADVFTAQLPPIKAALLGMMEVSRGLDCIAGLALPLPLRYVLLIAASAFGGLCCAAQSARMLGEIGIPMKRYLRARLGIAVLAVILAVIFLWRPLLRIWRGLFLF